MRAHIRQAATRGDVAIRTALQDVDDCCVDEGWGALEALLALLASPLFGGCNGLDHVSAEALKATGGHAAGAQQGVALGDRRVV